jgi:hypothetical protein
MTAARGKVHRWLPGAVWLLGVVGLSGCDSGPKTEPIRGKVEMPAATLEKLLAKEVAIHFRLDSDKNVQASGVLAKDGTFEVMMLHEGKVLTGALPGPYSACLAFEDQPEPEQPDDDAPPVMPKLSKSIVPYRYLTFDGSGWKLTVPSSGDVVFKVEPR